MVTTDICVVYGCMGEYRHKGAYRHIGVYGHMGAYKCMGACVDVWGHTDVWGVQTYGGVWTWGAFVTPFGKFEFLQMPFRLTMAPSYFQQMMLRYLNVLSR